MDKTKLTNFLRNISLICMLTIAISILFTNSLSIVYSLSAKEREKSYVCSKKNIQKHFLNYGIYIGFDDILAEYDTTSDLSDQRNSCYVQLPLKFEIPLVGVFVYTWKYKID